MIIQPNYLKISVNFYISFIDVDLEKNIQHRLTFFEGEKSKVIKQQHGE